MSNRILGYVMARNEWPLLGLAICHAFKIGLDHVVVVDHASNDGTREGLEQLENAFPHKVTVIRLEMDQFLQEATTTVVMAASNASKYDWVYVFDADEFLLLPGSDSLLTLLATVSLEVEAIRYEVHQWVAPRNLNDLEVGDYLQINKRTIPSVFINQPGELLAYEIQYGNVNYFDLAFPSKLIVRGRYAHELSAGAHIVTPPNRQPLELKLGPQQLRCGHIPLLSRRRLKLKSDHGQAMFDANFPPAHGWQNQALRRVEIAGDLESYWEKHSISELNTPETIQCSATVTIDDALTVVLKSAVEQYSNTESKISRFSPSQIHTPRLVLDNIIELVHALKTEHSHRIHGLNEGLATRDFRIDYLTQNLTAHENRIRVSDILIESLSREISIIKASTSWKITAPLRNIVIKLRKLTGRV